MGCCSLRLDFHRQFRVFLGVSTAPLPWLLLLSKAIHLLTRDRSPCAWIVISEIFPLSMRAKGVSFGGSANWVCSFVL